MVSISEKDNLFKEIELFNGTPLTTYLNRNKQYAVPRETLNSWLDYETNKSFEEIVDERVIEIKNTQSNVILLWSGGLDSTMLLLKFIKHNVNFKIVMTEMSMVENYNLYQEIINNKFNNFTYTVPYEIINSDSLLYYIKNNTDKVFITGDLGDQLFLSNLTYKYFYENMDIPYRIIVPQNVIKYTEERVNKILSKPIDATIANWCWAIDFIYKWDMLDTMLSKSTCNKNIISFFNTLDFQKWSVSNQIENSRFDKFTDKKEIRKIISNLHWDKDWLKYKTKIGSQRMFFNPELYKLDYNENKLGV